MEGMKKSGLWPHDGASWKLERRERTRIEKKGREIVAHDKAILEKINYFSRHKRNVERV